MLTDPYTSLNLHAARADELRAEAAHSRRVRLARHAAGRDDGARSSARWWLRRRPAVS